ncbi:unnamed protein product [Dovyalis caffra]|uniref:Ribosomal protein L22 n=1 Tax=Dovyalis caffra TaxID=77055 RepID=A0AAV1RBJ7_9ROSI|nr:unnamed protein product [Dovyalis caffra]
MKNTARSPKRQGRLYIAEHIIETAKLLYRVMTLWRKKEVPGWPYEERNEAHMAISNEL